MQTVFYRQALRFLPLMLVLACVAELVASIAAWGAAVRVAIPAWETTFVGLCFGVPGLLLGALSLRDVLRKTRDSFSVSHVLLAGGVFIMLIAILVEAGLALRIADPATYDSLRNADGALNTSAGGFVYIGVFVSLLVALGLAVPAYLYPQAINPSARTPFDRRPDEPDGIGEMLRGQHGPRTGTP